MTKEQRKEYILPMGNPRYVRCYDNGGKTADRYTIVFTGKRGGGFYLGCSSDPFHPQGFAIHGETSKGTTIDRPTYSHLGKRISFHFLPEPVKKLVLEDYRAIWEV